MRIIRAVTDRRQIISFLLFVYKDTLEDKSYLVYFVDVSSAGSGFLVQTEARRAEKIFFWRPPPLISKVWIRHWYPSQWFCLVIRELKQRRF